MAVRVQVVVSVPLVDPQDHMADWELSLPSLTREGRPPIPLAQEKILIQNSKCSFC